MLDVEQPLYEVTTLLNAASLLHRCAESLSGSTVLLFTASPSATSGHGRKKIGAEASRGRQLDDPPSDCCWGALAPNRLIGGSSAKPVTKSY